MPLIMKNFLFFLGVLWVILLLPGTSADPTGEDSLSELPYVIYPMLERIYKDDITCYNSDKDNTMNLSRGVKCLSDDGATEVTVPLPHRDCRSPAKKLTITVNREDDVVIEFRNTLNLTQMTRRQDPKKPYEKINMTDESKLIVPHDKANESGVYLFGMDNNQPVAPRECAVVINRRECPANRYGDQCSLWCPDCMHGGICDAKTGKCVCPPGLRGELCEEACEGDQIINSCTENPWVTSNRQICLPSPYGCSCAPGKKGYLCNEGCDPGSWGVNCLQRCNHCVSGTCNTVTGKCSSGPEDPCAGGPKGYLRFRQEPDVELDEDKVTVTFVKEFDGEEPISRNITYRVVIWEKGQSMNNMTTSKEVNATKMSVEIQGLTPLTNYYAAVLVKFSLNGKVCEIDGTLRGERIQKKLFTTICPKGKISNITLHLKSEEGFKISWKEEAYAKHCNYTYEVKVERVSDGKEIYNNNSKNPSHSQDGLETDTEYTVSITVVSDEGRSDPFITTIKTFPKPPTTPPSPERVFEDSGSVTYKWNKPSDVKGNISYKYTYEVKPIACGEETEISADKETQATEVSFPKPLPYARVTFRIAIGNEAGFSQYEEKSHETDPEVPAIKVEKIDCGDYKSSKQCKVTLENDCRKNNGKDLDIEAVWKYETNSARDPKSGNIQADSFRRENTHENYIIDFPRDFYHHTTYQLAVYVKNEAGTNESSGCLSKEIITPPVAPGKVKITRSVSALSSIYLEWNPAPSFPPTGDIEEYVINLYKTQDKTYINTFVTTKESYCIRNLDPDVSYTIHVSGINKGVDEHGEAAVTVIATGAQRPTTPPSVHRIFEDSGSVTYKWNRPSDVEGNISYKYTYEVKPIACDEATENPAVKETEATEVSFPKPLPYARVTFRIAIGNEAGFSQYEEKYHETDPEVPAIKVEKIDCGDYKSSKQCKVTLENDCRKNNGKDLDIEAVWKYETNSARDPKSGNIQADSFRRENTHENYIIDFPRDFYHHTTYQLAVYVKNEAGTNESSGCLSKEIITPPVAPGKVKITRIVSSHSSLDSGWDPKLSFPPTGDINGYVIDLGWDPLPSFPPTGNINGYVIEVYETRHREFIGGFVVADESCVISYLDPDASYTIHVSGINEGVPQPGEAAIIVISTLAYKPSQPINFLQDSSLSCNAQWDDENIPLSEDLIFQNEDYSISEKEHKKDTTKTVDIGTGEGENKSFQPEKNYNLLVVTEKKSGHNSEFSVSDPVSTKGKAVASDRTGILLGVIISITLIGLIAWTYKSNTTWCRKG
ncbi:uncharacterized protein [Palaemon carinicauda]|uniref:uncharacterized protein isoform X2 n=1 Tax=Palaemon carinicauda TaxID=392227 RepID=UPI0035B645A2